MRILNLIPYVRTKFAEVAGMSEEASKRGLNCTMKNANKAFPGAMSLFVCIAHWFVSL